MRIRSLVNKLKKAKVVCIPDFIFWLGATMQGCLVTELPKTSLVLCKMSSRRFR